MAINPNCPIPNPQTCCQVVVHFETQLVPPAIEDTLEIVDIKVEAAIEAVCPEKVIVCGKVIKKFTYDSIDSSGIIRNENRTDERAFQCFIDRDDADEGVPSDFVITGAELLCEASMFLQNQGTRTDVNGITHNVFWKFKEKDIIKVCIRKANP
ncbi:hypothetical protein [Pseudoneobacillus sp. C159]